MKRILLSLALVILYQHITDGECNMERNPKTADKYQHLAFSPELMLEYIRIKCMHPEIVYKQFMLESGHGKSRLCKEQNNYFGMKHPRIRPTLSVKDSCGYAYFTHWTASVDDYRMYQEYRGISDSSDYKRELIANYYSENESYIKLIDELD